MERKKNVALALSSGGPRGFAYIGAIEELERRGYTITSVAGTSAGSLVGGIYAAGGLDAFKKWLFDLDNFKVFSLMDLEIGKSYFVKGDKVIEAIKEVVPDMDIRDLPIPFTTAATDLYSGERVVFREGKLFDAIRASISVPSMFRPVKSGYRTLIDGGIASTMPLDLVQRHDGDILVAFNVNQTDAAAINRFLETRHTHIQKQTAEQETGMQFMDYVRADDTMSVFEKARLLSLKQIELSLDKIRGNREVRSLEEAGEKDMIPVEAADNYYSLLSRTFNIMNHTIASLELKLTPPDVLVEMSMDSYGAVSDYAKAREISEKGRELMASALDAYEARTNV